MEYSFASTAKYLSTAALITSIAVTTACSSSSASDETHGGSASLSAPLNVITIGDGDFKTSSGEDTDTFQRAIDLVSQKGGGQVIVRAGRYTVHNVDLQNGVQIMFKPGVVLQPGKGRGANLFNCGKDGETVSNVGLIGPKERFTVDFSGSEVEAEVRKLRVIGVGDCDGFRFANFDVIDKYTVFSSLIFGWDGHEGGRAKHGRNGLVENITTKNAHYGYGAIQAHSGENITFRNIKSFGGVAVRLETGLVPMNKAQVGGLDEILVDGAYSKNGQAALMFQPHTMDHGSIIARNIEADGSEFAVSIAKPFVSKRRYTADDNLTPGQYKSLTIDNVKSTYRDGPITTRFTHLKYYPEALHPLITRAKGTISQPELRGPSIAAVSLQDNLSENITITNIEAIGFKHHPDIITKKNVFKGNLRSLGGPRIRRKNNQNKRNNKKNKSQ